MLKVLDRGVVDFGLSCLSSANVGGLRREDEKCQRYGWRGFSFVLAPVSGGMKINLHASPARNNEYLLCLEPISKSSEEDNEAGELYKAEEVLSVILPADEDATLPLYPSEEALDEPAPRVTA